MGRAGSEMLRRAPGANSTATSRNSRFILSFQTILFISLFVYCLSSVSTSVLTLFTFPPSSVTALSGPTTVSTLTREGREAVFDDVWETIRTHYYDPELRGVDWNESRNEFRPQAVLAATSRDFYTILRRMINRLRDTHTRVYSPDEKFDWEHPRFIGVGVSLREIEGLPTVFAVETGSLAERSGLRRGDVIDSIDGSPALVLFERGLNELNGAPGFVAARLRAMAGLFDGPANSAVEVRWLDTAGRFRTASLRREWRVGNSSFHIKDLRRGYFLVEFSSFTHAAALELNRAIAGKLAGARGLVIDLRNNGGGETEAMTEIASIFLPVDKHLGYFLDRVGNIEVDMKTRAMMIGSADAVQHFGYPVVVLVSERTSSAAEILASSLADTQRASIVGTKSCGCVLAIRSRHTLPDGGEMTVSELDYMTKSGKRLEANGVTPKVIIAPTRNDLRTGTDRAILSALEELKALSN